MRTRIALLIVILLAALATLASADEIADLKDPRPGDMQVVGFELNKPANIDLSAVSAGEGWRDQYYCYSWLLDSKTREPVWVFGDSDDHRSSHHGRLVRESDQTLTLKPGRYELYLYTLDYHNSPVVISGLRGLINAFGDLFDDDRDDDIRRAVRDCYVRLESDDVSKDEVKYFDVTGEMPDAVLQMTRISDNEYVQKGISLKKPMSFRIYALFEQPGSYDTPVDFAWIVNEKTRERVWQIDTRRSGWAGGGEKNRIYDDTVSLDAGDYIVYYATDDSHSWNDFNVTPPFDPMNWGITLLPGNNFDAGAFSLFVPAGRNEPIIDLTRARNNRMYQQAFRLDKDGKLNVVAVGEFDESDDRFADYGWIENSKGDIVWEMDDRNTVPGGGAAKNRMFDGIVSLPKGDYIVRYITDGSHAYHSWNADAPYDPAAWGIAIYPTELTGEKDIKEISEDDIDLEQGILARMNRVGDNEYLHKEFKLDKPSEVKIYAIGEGDRDEMYDYAWIENADTRRVVWEMTYRNTDRAGGARKNRMFDNYISLDAGSYVVYYQTDGSHAFNDWNDARPDDPAGWGVTVKLAEK